MTRIREVRQDTSISKVTPGHFMGDVSVGGLVTGIAGFDLPATDPTNGQWARWDAGLNEWVWIDESDLDGSLIPGIAQDAEGAVAIRYTFSTTTTDSDPGAGILRLSNASQYLAVTARCDLADVAGADVTAELALIADQSSTTKGYLRIQKTTDPTKWLLATVSAFASPSGYRNVTIANIAKSANSPFADGDPVTLIFVPSTVGLAAAIAAGTYALATGGGEETVKAHGTTGSTETINLADGNYHTATLDANCTISFSGVTNGVLCRWWVELDEDGTGGWTPTWPGSIVWVNGVAPTHDTTAGGKTIYAFASTDGGVTVFAGAGGGQITVKDESIALATPASSLDFVGAGVTASGTGAGKTITIPGTPTGAAGGDLSGTYPNPSVVDDSHAHTGATLSGLTEAQIYGIGGHFEVLMDPATSSPPVPLTTPDGTDWVYGWLSDGG